MPKLDVRWTTPSTGITEAMPIGNGAVAALVWAQADGDLVGRRWLELRMSRSGHSRTRP